MFTKDCSLLLDSGQCHISCLTFEMQFFYLVRLRTTVTFRSEQLYNALKRLMFALGER